MSEGVKFLLCFAGSLVFVSTLVIGIHQISTYFSEDVHKRNDFFKKLGNEEILKFKRDYYNSIKLFGRFDDFIVQLNQKNNEGSKSEKVFKIPEKSPLKFSNDPYNMEIKLDGTVTVIITSPSDAYKKVRRMFKNAGMKSTPKSNEESQPFKLDEESQTPLESFNIFLENNVKIFDNTSINIFLIFFFIIFYLSILNNNLNIKKNIMLILCVKGIFDFFFNNFKNLASNIRFERYFFLLFSVFLYIIFENIGGLYLLELSYNSHAIITLFLSFFLFFNYFINFVINFNENLYIKFLQKNINVFFAIFLFLIEIISFLIRPFSLGIRLFANILSGHILIHIFFNVLIFTFKFFFWYSFLIFMFCLFIMGMEIFVGFIQAYIFFILNLIYLKDISKLH